MNIYEAVLERYAASSPLMSTLRNLKELEFVPIDCLLLVAQYSVYHELLGQQFDQEEKNYQGALECYEVAISTTNANAWPAVDVDTGIRGTGIVNGNGFTAYRLGVFYWCGMNVVKINLEKANEYFKIAAAKGVGRAACIRWLYFGAKPKEEEVAACNDELGILGFATEKGRWPEEILLVRDELCKKSEQGNEDATFILSIMASNFYYTASPGWNISRTLGCWRNTRAPLESNAQSQYLYGQFLLNGPLAAKDANFQEGLKWLRRSALQGHLYAAYVLSCSDPQSYSTCGVVATTPPLIS